MGGWTYTILENYCVFRSMSRKVWKATEARFGKNGKLLKAKWEKIPNKNYIPAKERPKWCVKTNKELRPRFRCLCDEHSKRCPFYAMTEADKEEHILLDRMMDRKWKLEEAMGKEDYKKLVKEIDRIWDDELNKYKRGNDSV